MLFSSKHRPLPAIAYAWLSVFRRQCLLQRKVGSQDFKLTADSPPPTNPRHSKNPPAL